MVRVRTAFVLRFMTKCTADGPALALHSNGYLAAGHALRMGLDLGLHRALDKMAEGAAVIGVERGKVRREDEERDLIVSARIFLGLYWLDFVLSTGNGRPHIGTEYLVSSDKLACMLRYGP